MFIPALHFLVLIVLNEHFNTVWVPDEQTKGKGFLLRGDIRSKSEVRNRPPAVIDFPLSRKKLCQSFFKNSTAFTLDCYVQPTLFCFDKL